MTSGRELPQRYLGGPGTLCRQVVQPVQATRQRASQGKSTERVAHFLVELDALYRQRDVSAQPLSLKMTRADIADYLGLTIETVSRAIGRLKKRNVIGLMGSDEVVVLDNDLLGQIGKVSPDSGIVAASTDRVARRR